MHRIIPMALLAVLAAAVLPSAAQDKAQRTDAEKKALVKIQQLGGLALELAQNDARLEVSFLQRDGNVTDDCLAPLKELKGLVHLNLAAKEATDASLAHLKDLTALIRLHLEKNPKITDKGLENLKGLVNLEYLNLYGTSITDAGLIHLEGMKKLKNLYLWQTKVTDAGVTKLKKALPQLEIVRGFDLDKPKEEKKPEKKPEPKKDAKKPEKKPDAKKDDKKPDAKKDEKKPEKKPDAKNDDTNPAAKKEEPSKKQ